jgi:hypothetical protein
MTEQTVKNAVERIIEMMDKSVLLGAAYDCMLDSGKASFQKKLEQIIIESSHE